MESKTEVIDRELERELDNLILLELRQKKNCLRFGAILESSDENIIERIAQALTNYLMGRRKTQRQR